jgi:hypothetical protein
MIVKHANYQSYLLRLWRADEATPWRASLHSVSTEQLLHFADLNALIGFLLAQFEANECLRLRDDHKPEDKLNGEMTK